MAEALPVNEQITQQIMETLATVVAGATYKITLIPLRWAKKLPAAAHYQAVLHEGDDNELGDDETPCGFKAWTREYAVQIYVLHQGLAAGQAWGTAKNLARADVERALMVDVTRDGLAHNTEIRSPMDFMDANDVGGVIVYFDVTYRTAERNPYEPAPSST